MSMILRFLKMQIGSNDLWQIITIALLGICIGYGSTIIHSFEAWFILVALILVLLGTLVAVLIFSLDVIKYSLILLILLDTSLNVDFHTTCVRSVYIFTCGPNISLTLLILLALYVIWFFQYINKEKKNTKLIKIGLPGVFAFLFLLSAILSMIPARIIIYSIYQIWIFVVIFLLYIYLVNNLNSHTIIKLFIYGLLLSFTVHIGIMFLQGVGVLGIDAGKVTHIGRVNGLFGSPNFAGGFATQVSVIVLSMALWKKNPIWQRILFGIIFLITLFVLYRTQSRGAWIGGVASISLFLFIALIKKWFSKSELLLLVFTTLIAGLLLFQPVLDRLQVNNGAAYARLPLMQIAFNMINDNPIFGVGANNFGVRLQDYIGLDQYGEWLNLVHNFWLLLWAEMGTLGLITYVAFWCSGIALGLYLIYSNAKYSVLLAGVICSLSGASIHMLVEIYNSRSLIQLAWVLIALIVAVYQLYRQETNAVVQ